MQLRCHIGVVTVLLGLDTYMTLLFTAISIIVSFPSLVPLRGPSDGVL